MAGDPASELMIVAIADYLIDALDADPLLSEVKVFVRGPATVPIPATSHPMVEVIVLEDDTDEELTNDTFELTYTGQIDVTLHSQNSPDRFRPTGRKLVMDTYDQVARLVYNILRVLERPEHDSLGDLRVTNDDVTEVVTQLLIGGPREYGAGQAEGKTAWENFGSIPFSVETTRGPEGG